MKGENNQLVAYARGGRGELCVKRRIGEGRGTAVLVVVSGC
jgi:hypothetical protein